MQRGFVCLALVSLLSLLACNRNACVRHGDCAEGFLCGPAGYCVVAPVDPADGGDIDASDSNDFGALDQSAGIDAGAVTDGDAPRLPAPGPASSFVFGDLATLTTPGAPSSDLGHGFISIAARQALAVDNATRK